MERRFASLHNHTVYSLLDSVSKVDDLVKQAADFGFKAISLTEHGNMFSVVEGFKAAQKYGIKFIPGIETYETTDMDYKEKDSGRYHLILLAKNETGYKNLCKLATEANTRGFYFKPRVDLETLRKYSEGVICLTACLAGKISRALLFGKSPRTKDGKIDTSVPVPDWDLAIAYVKEYKEIFGDNFYIELQCHDTPIQEYVNKKLLHLAKITKTKYVITFDSHMLSKEQIDVHRTFVRIAQEREVEGETYEGCWQVSLDELHNTMDKQIGYEAVEEAIKTTDEIADSVNFEFKLHQNLMPHISIPREFNSDIEYLKYLINEGWKKRGFNKLPKELKKQYKKRLRNELEVIEYLDYASYFIMLKQFINEVKKRNIPMGYGRGSAGGCLILYTLGVTEIDSIRWNLDFSRFANKGRKGSPADVDLDISKRRRQEAIEILVDLFGRDRISNLATFNSLSPKVCIRDIGKVLHEDGVYDLPYKVRDAISKLIPDDPNEHMTIERALEASTQLQKYAEMYPILFEYTKVLQNVPKSVGCHASAIIVGKEDLVNYAPLMYNKDGNIMLSLEMHNAQEDLGLIKFDILGLRSLDVVEDTLKLAGLTWDDIRIDKVNFKDMNILRNIYENGNTLGIFQMESKVCQDMFKEIKPDDIEDIIAVAALNRPAVLSVGMDKQYIYGKHNKEEALSNLIHPELKPIFAPTNGIMLYQEQCLQVFALAGFDEAHRDVARRAVGKKKKDVMESLYKEFEQGLLAKNTWSKEQVKAIWELVKAQAGYSFNRSHSVSYGILSYIMATLKYYYPVEFMAALLISKTGDYEETTKYIHECRRLGIEVLPPDINKSDKDYSIIDGKILFGLSAIKGIGSAADTIIEVRNVHGPFKNLQDFTENVKIDTGSVTNLIKSGAFSQFSRDKIALLLEYGKLLFTKREFKPVKSLPTKKKLVELSIEGSSKEELLEKYNEYKRKQHEIEQYTRFTKHMNEFKEKYMQSPEMFEYSTLNIFLADPNPFEIAEGIIKPFDQYEEDGKVVIGGTITNIKYGKQKNGARFARLEVLTFNSGMLEGVAFAKQFAEYQDLIKKGTNVVILAKKSEGQFLVEQMKTLEQWKKDIAPWLKRRQQKQQQKEKMGA